MISCERCVCCFADSGCRRIARQGVAGREDGAVVEAAGTVAGIAGIVEIGSAGTDPPTNSS